MSKKKSDENKEPPQITNGRAVPKGYNFIGWAGGVEPPPAEETAAVYKDKMDESLACFCEDQRVEDLGTVSQAVWYAALMYTQERAFPNRKDLRSKMLIGGGEVSEPGSRAGGTTHCAYDPELLSYVVDLYIYYCMIYNKDPTIYGFKLLTKINLNPIYQPYDVFNADNYIDYNKYNNEIDNNNNNNKYKYKIGLDLKATKPILKQKLLDAHEEYLAGRLQDPQTKGTPVGILAILNHQFSWNMPGVTREVKPAALPAAELPRLDSPSEPDAGGTDL